MAHIFVIEDDEVICTELRAILAREGYATTHCTDFVHATQQVQAAHPNLVLLDLTLPRTDGQLLCREIRALSSVPIIVLTSRTDEADEVISLTLGADDFVAKPYRARVLLARIAALLARSLGAEVGAAPLEYAGVVLDRARSEVSCGSHHIELTKNELKILAILMLYAGTIVMREDLMRELWESDAFVDDNILTVNINRLRTTLAKIGVHDYLVTH